LPTDEYWLQIKALVSDRWFGYGEKKIIKNFKSIAPELEMNNFRVMSDKSLEIDVTSKGIRKLILQSSNDGGKVWNNEETIELTPSKKQKVLFSIKKSSSSMIYRVLAPD